MVGSLVFCVGPLTILGSLTDGLGNGADQLYLKATLDGFAAIAFAASFGWGVGASASPCSSSRAAHRASALLLGDVLPDAHIARAHAPSVACCSSGSRCACCGSARSRSPTCFRRCWWRRCCSAVGGRHPLSERQRVLDALMSATHAAAHASAQMSLQSRADRAR